jgi:hypothetical protein
MGTGNQKEVSAAAPLPVRVQNALPKPRASVGRARRAGVALDGGPLAGGRANGSTRSSHEIVGTPLTTTAYLGAASTCRHRQVVASIQCTCMSLLNIMHLVRLDTCHGRVSCAMVGDAVC